MVELKFQAYASLKPGEKLQPWEYEPAPLGNNDVEIAVTHNGLCHTDIHMRDNDWSVSKFPLVAGHEVVGNVTQVGGQVTGIKIGDRWVLVGLVILVESVTLVCGEKKTFVVRVIKD